MNGKVINTRLGEIEFSSIGEGIPVLILHGGHSNCHETLCTKGFDLNKFQLITPSRPGYGKTPLNNNKTPAQAADLIVELLAYLSIDKVIVYGISAGGLTAIAMAGNHPNKVSKLILASAISKKWLNERGKVYQTAKKIFNPKVEKLTWGMVRFFSMLFPNTMAKQFYPQFSKFSNHKLNQEDIRELVSSMKNYNSKMGFVNDIDQNINNGLITKVKCPTLIIHSEYDNSVSLTHPEHANKMIKNSKIEIIQNEWGHLLWIGADSKESIIKTLAFIEE